MEHYINNLLFTYFPHIAMAVFWFGLITRLIKTNKTIQAQSTQFFSDRKIRLGSNLFHVGMIMVFLGHFTGLFTPETLYHIVITTETKRIIAIMLGSIFGTMTLVGMIILITRRIKDEKVRVNSNFQDYFLLFLLLFEVVLGLISVTTTATSSVEHYASLGVWAQKLSHFNLMPAL
ncbi:MAG: respiratory nitrate reductase subunit gamma [Bacteroidales bacterium]|nr:respiratory nitrate reductase subunit gamma [Bacteroidales bacterium]